MLIIDGHLDLAWNALQWNRDLLQSVYTLRVREKTMPGPGRGQGTVAIPEMREGRICVAFATILARSTGTPVEDLDYSSAAQAYGIGRGQLAYYVALEKQGHIRILTDLAGLDDHMQDWETWDRAADSAAAPPLGIVISMESADPILNPDQLQEWWEGGVRLIGPAHYGPGRYAGGTGTEMGLTGLGVGLLSEMGRLGIILDLTHLSDVSFWEALKRYDGPVLASHNNSRALIAHQRQFSDAQLMAIFEREGVVGAALDVWMLQLGWIEGESSNDDVVLAMIVDHIDHVNQLAGDSSHAALGTDLDGGFGKEQSPFDLDTIADLQNVVGTLVAREYGAADIAAVMHGNWLQLLRRAWRND